MKKKKRGRKPALTQKVQLTKKPALDASGGTQSTMPSDSTQRNQVHSTASTKQPTTPVPRSTANLEIDPNLDRRKRRKTVSPIQSRASPQENDWEAQLRTAAYGDESIGGIDGLLNHKQEPQPGTPPETPHDAALGLETQCGRKNIGLRETGSMIEIANPKTSSPPKKVLKLRKDGKLGSPKTKQAPTPEKRKRGRPVGKIIRKAMIVALKYGEDDQSRTLIGQKIEQLLSSPINAHYVQAAVEKASNARQSTPQLPKATHPFFLAKPATKNEPDIAPKVISATKPSQAHSKASPRKNATAPSDKTERAWPTFASKDSIAVSKYPGSRNPPWPSNDNLHVRGEAEELLNPLPSSSQLKTFQHPQKLKATEVRFTKTVLDPWTESVQNRRIDHTPLEDDFRRMQRRLMTGLQLQSEVTERLGKRPLVCMETQNQQDEVDELQITQDSNTNLRSCHYAIERLYKTLLISSSAFDNFQCEPQSWIDKYAPSCAAEVLQQGKEVYLLRDWLQRLTVSAVEAGNMDVKKDSVSKVEKKARLKKKRKRAEQLDGFVISDDEEADEMDELTDPDEASAPESAFAIMKKSVMRNGDTLVMPGKYGEIKKDSHAVVISGPHGCGKTAAVYAVARELDFEVFEINPGTRRNGKDLMDKVGDMTRNHLVQRSSKSSGQESSKITLPPELDEVGQSKLQAFLKPKTLSKRGSKTGLQATKLATETTQPVAKPKVQKQSLILLEEVDILFEEDKHFWSTVLELIAQSKRPIIMTCSDEPQLPLEELSLHAIFRLKPPPEHLLTDYLLLLAANEGHLLRHNELSKLCHLKHNDLRASTHEINFWCQMGIGDRKGGLEWMPIPSDTISYTTPEGRLRRVISDDTYCGSLSSTSLSPSTTAVRCKDSVPSRSFDKSQTHGVKLEKPSDDAENVNMHSTESKGALTVRLEQLRILDQAADAVSASDLCLAPEGDSSFKVSTFLIILMAIC